jgi:hypothetical protein
VASDGVNDTLLLTGGDHLPNNRDSKAVLFTRFFNISCILGVDYRVSDNFKDEPPHFQQRIIDARI